MTLIYAKKKNKRDEKKKGVSEFFVLNFIFLISLL
jgi:hypothetical protein